MFCNSSFHWVFFFYLFSASVCCSGTCLGPTWECKLTFLFQTLVIILFPRPSGSTWLAPFIKPRLSLPVSPPLSVASSACFSHTILVDFHNKTRRQSSQVIWHLAGFCFFILPKSLDPLRFSFPTCLSWYLLNLSFRKGKLKARMIWRYQMFSFKATRSPNPDPLICQVTHSLTFPDNCSIFFFNQNLSTATIFSSLHCSWLSVNRFPISIAELAKTKQWNQRPTQIFPRLMQCNQLIRRGGGGWKASNCFLEKVWATRVGISRKPE